MLAVAEVELERLEEALDAAEAEGTSLAAREALLEGHRRRPGAATGAEHAPARSGARAVVGEHEPFRRLWVRLFTVLLGGETGLPARVLAMAHISATIGGAVVHPFVQDLDNETLRAELLQVTGDSSSCRVEPAAGSPNSRPSRWSQPSRAGRNEGWASLNRTRTLRSTGCRRSAGPHDPSRAPRSFDADLDHPAGLELGLARRPGPRRCPRRRSRRGSWSAEAGSRRRRPGPGPPRRPAAAGPCAGRAAPLAKSTFSFRSGGRRFSSRTAVVEVMR